MAGTSGGGISGAVLRAWAAGQIGSAVEAHRRGTASLDCSAISIATFIRKAKLFCFIILCEACNVILFCPLLFFIIVMCA